MKKQLFLISFFTFYFIAQSYGQKPVEVINTGQTELKEGDNLIKSTSNISIYATVKNKKVVRVFGVDTKKKVIEVEGFKRVSTQMEASPNQGPIQMPPMCIECRCVLKWAGRCARWKCRECPPTRRI